MTDPRVEAAAQQMAAEFEANCRAGHPWALGMGDRYAAERILEAADKAGAPHRERLVTALEAIVDVALNNSPPPYSQMFIRIHDIARAALSPTDSAGSWWLI